MLKGIAILLMLFLHLFSNPDFAATTTPLLWIGELPFATIFTRACNPVGFFLVCSGYGLAYSYLHSKLSLRIQTKRVVRLYLNYWLILFLFIGVGSICFPEYYPGTFKTIINNVTGWSVDEYDHPAWFLLPYCLLCLTSPLVFRVMDRIGLWWSLILSFILSIASMYVISKYIAPAKAYHEWYTMFFTYFDLLFAFVVGAFICLMGAKRKITFDWLKEHQYVGGILVFVWFALHCLTGSAAIGTLFLCLFMMLYVNLEIPRGLNTVLLELGNKSMVMWLIHAFIYGRFFHDFIYGFKYPLLIFLALVISSYLLSIPIMYLSKQTIGRIEWLNKKS